MALTFGSLFSGIGGLDLGIERAGWVCKFQVEIDPFCRKVLDRHWPEVPKYGDIHEVKGTELPPVDLLAGGFPCTDLSQAGKRAGLTDADGIPTRSGLWFEFARLIGELRPKYVLAENVPGLLTMPGAMGRIIGDFAKLGYVGSWFCLRASDFGAGHLRKRVFIIAMRADLADPLSVCGQRRGDGGKLAVEAAKESRKTLERERNGNAVDNCCDDLADACGARRSENTRSSFSNEEANGRARRDVLESKSDHEPCRQGSGLANSEIRGWGELRKSSAGDRLADGSDEAMASPASNNRGRQIIPAEEGTGSQGIRRNEAGSGTVLSGAGEQGLPDTESNELSGTVGFDERRTTPEFCGAPFIFAPGPSDPRWPGILREFPWLAPTIETQAQPGVHRVAIRTADLLERAMSHRTKRLRSLGNAVVPQIAQWIAERIRLAITGQGEKGYAEDCRT